MVCSVLIMKFLIVFTTIIKNKNISLKPDVVNIFTKSSKKLERHIHMGPSISLLFVPIANVIKY